MGCLVHGQEHVELSVQAERAVRVIVEVVRGKRVLGHCFGPGWPVGSLLFGLIGWSVGLACMAKLLG